MTKLSVCVIGGGSFGTTLANIVSINVKKSDKFNQQVKLWTFPEKTAKNVYLADWINEHHENPIYLPDVKLESNLFASNELAECVTDADLIIFGVPNQYARSVISDCKPFVSKKAKALSIIKGFDKTQEEIITFSTVIEQILQIPCSALSGANVAFEIAKSEICETNIGYAEEESGKLWGSLLSLETFKIRLVPTVKALEVCGAMKNIYVLAYGFCLAMNLGSNTLAMILRISLNEVRKFVTELIKEEDSQIYLESCGFPDLFTTAIGGRTVKCAKEFASLPLENRDWSHVEKIVLKNMKLQAHETCRLLYNYLSMRNTISNYPMLQAIYSIAFEKKDLSVLTQTLKNLPNYELTRKLKICS